MNILPELYLYNLTLRRPSAAVQCCIGNFTGAKRQQQIVRATGSAVQLWAFNKQTGVLRKVIDQHTYSNIRTINTVRPGGSKKDLVVITSDSSNICVLELNTDSWRFERVVSYPYFKTGIRPITPGEYIATDGRSRAFMISALLKNKFAYTVGRQGDTTVLSSPLEASQNDVVTFALCGLDVGFENPMFAAIEGESGRAPYKFLRYYELDLGLNHVVSKYSEEIPDSSNFLISVPGGIDGPSGVLVCSKGLVQYRYLSKMSHVVPIPRRPGQTDAAQIVAGVVHVLKSSFFLLLQDNFGNLFKVTVKGEAQDSDESDGQGGVVDSVEISYFDTIPVCQSLLIFRSGFLYSNCESGDQYIYQFEKLGDNPGEPHWISTDYPDDIAALSPPEPVVFKPRPFENLNLVYIIEDLNPLIDCKLYDSGNVSDLPVIYSLCGSGARSSLKVLNHELAYSEMATQELPSRARRVLAMSSHREDKHDKFIVISQYSETTILGVGEDVEEVEDSGLLTDVSTLNMGQVGSASIVQIHPSGIRQVFYSDEDKPAKTIDWSSPIGVEVIHSAMTNSQVVLALSNREIVYFETDDQDRLIEFSEHKEMADQITSVSLGEFGADQARFPFVFVGCKNNTLVILKTDPSATLEPHSDETLSSVPCSLMCFSMREPSGSITEIDEDESTSVSLLYLHIGMTNGVYARLRVDPVTGELSNPRNQYTGPREVQLSKLRVCGQNVVAVCSARCYLGYSTATDFTLTALSKPAFNSVCSFHSEDVAENGVLGVAGDSFTIMTVDQLDSSLLIESIGLRYTPKAMQCSIEQNGMVYVAEADYQTASPYTGEKELISYETDTDQEEHFQQFGYDFKAGTWASCIQVISVENKAVGQTVELDGNDAAFKMCIVQFASSPQNTFLAVSASTNQSFAPNKNSGSQLRLYRIEGDGSLELHHVTKLPQPALALVQFQGRLLVGMGDCLVIFELGKKQLLRKCTTKLSCCRQIVSLKTQGFRVVVADISNSVHYVKYESDSNRFVEFVDDYVQRHVSCATMLDYDTTVVGDKFGQISVMRCPNEDESSVVAHLKPKLNGAPYRLNNLGNFYLGDMPTSFQKGSLTIGGGECVLYTGLQGTIGCLHPLTSPRDIRFFSQLQIEVAKEMHFLTDREHLKYRSYIVPMKGCIDGDLLEEYFHLEQEQRDRISEKMERDPREIDRRISSMRVSFAY